MRVGSSLLGMVLMASAAATLAQTAVDRSFKVTDKNCSGVVWSEAALAEYPNIASACQAVEERDGKSYVRFQGTVERNLDRGKQVEIRVKGGDVIKVTPPENMALYINDRRKEARDLERGDQLNFYVPEDRFAAQFAQDTTPTPQFVVVPIIYRETESVYEEPERTAALPATASNNGLMAVVGALMIAAGALLTWSRRTRPQSPRR